VGFLSNEEKLNISIQVREAQNGYQITFSKRGSIRTKNEEHVAKTLDEFFTESAITAIKRLVG